MVWLLYRLFAREVTNILNLMNGPGESGELTID